MKNENKIKSKGKMKNENKMKMKYQSRIITPLGQDQFLTYISNQYFKTFDKNTKHLTKFELFFISSFYIYLSEVVHCLMRKFHFHIWKTSQQFFQKPTHRKWRNFCGLFLQKKLDTLYQRYLNPLFPVGDGCQC